MIKAHHREIRLMVDEMKKGNGRVFAVEAIILGLPTLILAFWVIVSLFVLHISHDPSVDTIGIDLLMAGFLIMVANEWKNHFFEPYLIFRKERKIEKANSSRMISSEREMI
jgi:hypothetical protein